MALAVKTKAHLKSLGLPSDVEMIRRARSFSLRAGLTYGELAELAGINVNSFRVWISGHYDQHNNADANTLPVRAAVKRAMDMHEVAHTPPSSGPHYQTAEYSAVRRSLVAALEQGTAFLVDGPPGTQKTYTFRRVAEEINRRQLGRAVYIYTRVDQSPQSFLMEACTEAGIPNRGTIDQLIRKLRFFLGGQRALLIVDEAQHLGLNGLEVLRQLLDTPPFFGVALGGSHDLSVRLRSWQMEQWRSRLRRAHLLKGLSEAEAGEILRAELGALHPADIAAAVKDATVTAVRDRKEFRYISARNLFFAIEDARQMIAEAQHANQPDDCATLKEAIA